MNQNRMKLLGVCVSCCIVDGAELAIRPLVRIRLLVIDELASIKIGGKIYGKKKRVSHHHTA